MANQNQGQGGNKSGGQSERGFAAMSDSQQREIARKGGEAVSEDRQHMAEIGRTGGEASAESRESSGGQQARSRSDDSDSGNSGGNRGGNQGSSGSGSSGSSGSKSGGNNR